MKKSTDWILRFLFTFFSRLEKKISLVVNWEFIFAKKALIACSIFLAGLGLVYKGYTNIYWVQYERGVRKFNQDAATFSNLIENKLLYYAQIISSLQAYFNTNGIPPLTSFKKFCSYYLKDNSDIEDLIWIPYVGAPHRKAFILEARKNIPNFEILEPQVQGKLGPASSQVEYFPLYYIASNKSHDYLIGFNFLTQKDQKGDLYRSIMSGEIKATTPFTFPLESDQNHKVVLIVAPIYRSPLFHNPLERKKQNFSGFVAGTVSIQKLMGDLPEYEKKKFNILLLDLDENDKRDLVFSSTGNHFPPPSFKDFTYEETISFGGESWSLQLTPQKGQYIPKIQNLDLFLLLLCFLFCLLASLYVWLSLTYYEKNIKFTQWFKSLFESTPTPKFIIDKNQKIALINQKAINLVGLPHSQLLDQPARILFSAQSYKKFEILKDKIMESYDNHEKQSFKIECMIRNNQGIHIPVELEMDPFIMSETETLFVCTLLDIRHIKDLQTSIEKATFYDSLTKLPNKTYVEAHLRKTLEKYAKTDTSVFVFIMNIDRFKAINESLGIAAGDKILKTIAKRLSLIMPPQSILARMNGDEFAVITQTFAKKSDAILFADKLVEIFQVPFSFNNKVIKLSASIGISQSFNRKREAQLLLNHAELAMYHTKHQGGNHYAFYRPGIEKERRRQFEIEAALHFAIERDELFLEYQPIYEVPSQKIIGIEALLRWHHPPLGLIPPNEFIPLIENKSFIKIIGKWVFEKACLDYQHLKNHFKGYMSINMTSLQLEDKGYLKELLTMCKSTHVPPHHLLLEITESTFMQKDQSIIKLMKSYTSKGFSFAVDDFGTKYASLERLSHMPFSYMKIDKIFIDGIGKNKTDEDIIIHVLTLAERLNIKVIAEGVETKEQLDFLLKHHCFYIQGYYFSKPLPFRDIQKILMVSQPS